MPTREQIIESMKQESTCPVAAFMEGELLCGYSTSAEGYDVYVWEEFFPYSELVDWQNDQLHNFAHKVRLGIPSPNKLKGIWATSNLTDNPFDIGLITALRDRFCYKKYRNEDNQ